MVRISGMSTRQRTWLSVSILALGALIFLAFYHPLEQWWQRDDAYLLYMAQGITRGELIYRTTTFGYAPFSAIINAAVISIGQVFGVPDYLSPRLVTPLLMVLSTLLTGIITARISGRRWVGLCAA